MFTRRFYIRFSADRLKIASPGVTPGFDEPAVVAISDKKIAAIGKGAETLKGRPGISLHSPFAHPRMVVGDFTVADKLLQGAVRAFVRAQPWTFVRPTVRLILHPLREFEGGLTQIEYRALRELADMLGAKIAAVHSGRELTAAEVEAYDFSRI